MPENAAPLPDFTRWPSFPFEGDMRVKDLAAPVAVEPPRSGEDASDCVACNTPDDAYIWENERWRVRAMDRPTGLPMVLILECRSHLDMGDLPNLLAAELGVMTVRLERAIRSLDGVARVHVNRWGDGSAHLHMWFLARPYGRLQLRGTFLSLWDDILPTIPEDQWRENLALVAAWLAEFGGHANTEPAHIQWQSPSTFSVAPLATGPGTEYASASNTDSTAATPADAGPVPESESGANADSNPARNADPGTANADSDPAAASVPSPAGTDSNEFERTDSTPGSGSDHASLPADEGATTGEGAEVEPNAEADEAAAEASSVTDSNADSEDVGERSDAVGGAASVWVADSEKGLWRPNDLGEAERPAPDAGANADPSAKPEAVEGAAEDSEDRQDRLRGPVADSVSEDGNEPGRAALIPPKDTEAPQATSTVDGNDRGSLGAVGTADDQTDASSETAGTLRS